jgi:RNA polymerase sigma-70 factor (ECF subfamily)
LATLYHRYLPTVWRYACGQLAGNLAAAEDVVSETFLAAVRQVGRLAPGGGTVGGWLLGIARHKVGDVRRRAGRTPAAEPGAADTGPAAPPADDPLASVEATETRGQVVAVLDTLPDDERQALEWKYLDGLSVREIAGRLGRTEKAVESVLFRARQSFRKTFEGIR